MQYVVSKSVKVFIEVACTALSDRLFHNLMVAGKTESIRVKGGNSGLNSYSYKIYRNCLILVFSCCTLQSCVLIAFVPIPSPLSSMRVVFQSPLTFQRKRNNYLKAV